MMADFKTSSGIPHRYKADLGELSPSTREVLERYSKIPPQEVMPHVYAVVGDSSSVARTRIYIPLTRESSETKLSPSSHTPASAKAASSSSPSATTRCIPRSWSA